MYLLFLGSYVSNFRVLKLQPVGFGVSLTICNALLQVTVVA